MKLKIIKYFTKIRDEINKKEEEFISIIEKQFDALFFKEDIINNYEKLPNEMKSLLENSKKIVKDWNDISKDTLIRYINDCINSENVIIQINELFKKNKIDNYELKMLACQNEVDDLDNSFINELKLNTDFIEKLINNYFSTYWK